MKKVRKREKGEGRKRRRQGGGDEREGERLGCWGRMPPGHPPVAYIMHTYSVSDKFKVS